MTRAVPTALGTDGSWPIEDFSLDFLPQDLYDLVNLPDNSFNLPLPSLPSLPSETSSLFDHDSAVLGSSWTDRDNMSAFQRSGTDPDLQLLQLQQDLMNLIISLRRRDWDIVATLRMEFRTGEDSVAPTDSMSFNLDFNPLLATFELISRFDSLLLLKIQSLHVPQAAPPARASSNQISSQYLLGAVACYMHILSAYDCIVSYLLDEFSRNPTIKDFVLYGAPQISIGGVHAPPLVNTLGRLLVRLLENRILSVESTLGLPEGVRISKDTSGRYSLTSLGLLGGVVGGKSILNMLADANLESELGDSRSAGLRRLREKLDCLQSLG
ncbi:hypothetical protein Micbo1qcDRAFT_203666 [Microdochium bolleyi]|uniref:Uncharacterized protein n=1 Tax=Microdochium bolleyi TaxID=196109 RepID=A0A136J8V1_9PEZI|nr:hypothetical protein Micbo1qcDRAFT_203666 [Microdochium bolleyi]